MSDYDQGQEAAHESAHEAQQQAEDDDYEDVEEQLPVELDDIDLNLVAEMSLDQSGIEYLAQADVPGTMDGVDAGASDYDDGTAVA